MVKLKSYKVKMAKGFPAEARHSRAGLTLQSNDTVVVELNPDQVKEIQDDRYMDIVEYTGEEEDQSADGGEGENSSDTTGEGNEADDPSEDEGAPTEDAGEAEEASSQDEGSEEGSDQESESEDGSDEASDEQGEEEAPSVDELCKANSRDELVAQAQAVSVELDYENKTEVTKRVIAEAIVAARG